MSNQSVTSAPSSPILDAHKIEQKLGKLVDEYRDLRDRLKAKRETYYERISKTYFKVASTPHAKPFFSIEGQQYCYNLAVLSIILFSYVGFCYPQYFHHVYTILMIILLVSRYYFYRHLQWTPFCFDFCYFANYIAMVALYTKHPVILSTAYTVCHGPVLLALIMWRNSLVFHSLDKLTSCSIHFLPALALYIRLYVVIPNAEALGLDTQVYTALPFSFVYNVVYPLAYYLLWQIGYSFYFDFLNADLFKANPHLQSSLRWFVTVDYDTPLVQFALKTARQTGFFQPQDDLRDDEWKTRILFQSFQLAYTLCTFPFALLSYSSSTISFFLLSVNLVYVINAGATFYLSTAFIKQRMAIVTKKLESQKRKREMLQQQDNSTTPTPQTIGNEHTKQIESKIKKRSEELAQLQNQMDEILKQREGDKLHKRKSPSLSSSSSSSSPLPPIQPQDTVDANNGDGSINNTNNNNNNNNNGAKTLEELLVGDESKDSAPEGEGDHVD